MAQTEKAVGQKRGKLKITQEDVVGIIEHIIEFDGLEAARKEYEHMCVLFATFPGWPETAAEILQLIAEKRKLQQEEQLQQDTERESTPFVYISNSNEVGRVGRTVNIPHMDQLNGFVEKGANVSHTKVDRGKL